MVQLSTLLATLALAITVVQGAPNVSRRQNLPDVAGEKNVGNGAGGQFIGGQCLGVADCASGCCATLPQGGQTIGVCSGVGAQNQAGKQGCGFEAAGAGGGNNNSTNSNDCNNQGGNQGGNENNPSADNGSDNGAGAGAGNNAAVGETIKASTLKPDPSGAGNVGNGQGRQFITGGCTGDADCASACCALVNTGVERFGVCSGPLANTQNGKQGCGFPVGGERLAPN
ncbi:hypothetical protein N0V88_007946 [Collariella sp. IMI 366227]|nr:hypothetical protein N0V88_007946 [Collariella sp. IMI 366227]